MRRLPLLALAVLGCSKDPELPGALVAVHGCVDLPTGTTAAVVVNGYGDAPVEDGCFTIAADAAGPQLAIAQVASVQP